YLVFGAHLLNAEAADALLKDLEEPPPYAVVVLVADELGPLPETIRSRCQLVPFRRLSERAVRQEVDRLAPNLEPDRATAIEREEILLALEELAAWYRDLVVVAADAERAVIHYDRLAELAEDAAVERMLGAERAAEIVRETWRTFEEFNVSPPLALEALFVQL